MFGWSKREKEQARLRSLNAQTHFYEHLCNYIIMIATSGGQPPFTLYVMLDYTSIQIMELMGVPSHQLQFMKDTYKHEHDIIIDKLSKGEQLDNQSFNENLKDQQEELKKLGIDFKLHMPEELKEKEQIDPTKMPKLTKAQIDKVIKDNYDKIIDLYLKKKKEKDKKNGPQGVQGRDV